jgi:hypothetical protein
MKLLKTIYSFFESIGQARAASYFARQGDYASARNIMLYDKIN